MSPAHTRRPAGLVREVLEGQAHEGDTAPPLWEIAIPVVGVPERCAVLARAPVSPAQCPLLRSGGFPSFRVLRYLVT